MNSDQQISLIIGVVFGVIGVILISAMVYYCSRRMGDETRWKWFKQKYLRSKRSNVAGDQQLQSVQTHSSSTNQDDSKRRPSFISIKWSNLRRKSQALIRGTQTSQTTHTQVTLVATNEKELTLPAYLNMLIEKDFEISQVMGEGGAGVLFTGQLINDQLIERNDDQKQCIIKLIKENPSVSEELRIGFMQEVAIMWLFKESKNFCKLLAYSMEPKCIIMRHYQLGSLKQFIHNKQDQKYQSVVYDIELISDMIFDIASGVAEMHHTGIVHNDLKPANILVDIDYQGKIYCAICDFGIAFVLNQSLMKVKELKKSQINGASLAYAAPEVLERLNKQMVIKDKDQNNEKFQSGSQSQTGKSLTDQPQIAKAADTYSFALIVYEILTRIKPWENIENTQELQQAVLQGLRPKIPDEYTQKVHEDPIYRTIINIIQQCWAQNPEERPQMRRMLPKIYKIRRKNEKDLKSMPTLMSQSMESLVSTNSQNLK